jgi:hypothetical protein
MSHIQCPDCFRHPSGRCDKAMKELLVEQEELYTELAEDALIAAAKRQQHSVKLEKELKIANKKIEACMDFFNENLDLARQSRSLDDGRLAWAMQFMIDKLEAMDTT